MATGDKYLIACIQHGRCISTEWLDLHDLAKAFDPDELDGLADGRIEKAGLIYELRDVQEALVQTWPPPT